jgi:hypothetical protein
VVGVLLSDLPGELLRLLLAGRVGEEDKVESWLGYEGEAGRGDSPVVVLRCGAARSLTRLSVKLPWRKKMESISEVSLPIKRRRLLIRAWCVLARPSGRLWRRGGGRELHFLACFFKMEFEIKLQSAGSNLASAIFCRHGGKSSTSI